ncbi:MAG: hypothetical protein LC623_02225 [Halobacteriales archaeon]|nr:hypothetical protein [Halobacteriales archaeon]
MTDTELQRREPAPFERIWIVEPTPTSRHVLGSFTGATAEAEANECLRQVARGLQSSRDARHVLVHAWMQGGAQFLFPHEVRALDTDDSVRGKIVHVLMLNLRDPSVVLLSSFPRERVREMVDALAGNPNVVREADKLRDLAMREMSSHDLRLGWEDGLMEYYAELAALLRLGYPAVVAVEKAKGEATQEAGEPIPDAAQESERQQCLLGIEAAWHQSRSFLNALEANA